MRTEADLLIENARLWTDGATLEDADAIAVSGPTILAVGRRAELTVLAGPRTRRVDARGGTVTPGLWDAHIHLTAWARSRSQLDLRGGIDRDEVVARVRGWNASHPGTHPLVGRGWDARTWSAAPDRAALDAVTGDRPTLLHSHDFHALWVNSAALRAAGVSRTTPDPEGGRFERDAAGEPRGLVREHAVRAFAALEADGAPGDDEALARAAAAALHAHGITGVHDMDPGAVPHRVLRGLAESGVLRVLKAIGHVDLDHALALGLASGTGDDRFRIGALKLFADGTLGSQTAAMMEPYEGGGTGMELMTAMELRDTVARALAGGLAVAVHAIGDRAVRHTLDAFEAARDAMPRAALPCRIEHVQIARREDLVRFAALGVAASVQPQHCTSDIELIERYWGARRDRAYPFESLRAAGALLAFGSDAPVEPPDTAAALHAAVSRQRPDRTPHGGYVAAERVSLDAALSASTEGPSRLAGAWPRVGRLAAGAAADLAVWDGDLHVMPRCELHHARVSLTVLDGQVVYEGAPAAAAAGGTR